MGNTFYFVWEVQLMQWIQSWLGDFGVKLMSFFSFFGEEYILVAVMAFLYLCWDKKAGTFVGMNVLTCMVVNPLIKNIFVRRRPYFDHEGVRCLKPVDKSADIYDLSAQGYSFPSGHTNNAASTYGSAASWFRKKWMWITAMLITALVGISRFSLGVHYPTDVLVGWAVGMLIVLVLSILEKKVQRKWIMYLVILLLAASGWFYCRSNDYFSGFGMMAGFFAGSLVEQKFVNFKETRVWWRIILRVAVGAGLYVALNKVLKLPFPKDLLESATMPQYIIRTVRYALIIFIIVAVYPMSFRILDKVLAKKSS